METSSDIIVVAAGSGKRVAAGINKMFVEIRGVPLLYRTLHSLNEARATNRIVVVLKQGERLQYEHMLKHWGALDKIECVAYGGETRADSARAGLHCLRNSPQSDIVMIHDGARPFSTSNLIDRLTDSAKRFGAAIPVVGVGDTVRQMGKDRARVIDRSRISLTQTPQAFRYDMIAPCFFSEEQLESHLTDDAAYIEKKGYHMEMVQGEKYNIKITTREDIAWAEFLLTRYPQLRMELREGRS